MSLCGHCGDNLVFAHEQAGCDVCGQTVHPYCRPCPKFVALQDRLAELETKMNYLDGFFNVPGLREREARIPEATPEYS